MENAFKNQVPLPFLFRAIEEGDRIRFIRMKGSVDVSKACEVEEFIRKFRAQKGFEFKHLLLDFSEVTFMDSAAVAMVIKTMLDYKKTSHRMAIVNPTSDLRNKSILEIYKVDQLIQVHQTEAEAIKNLKED